MDEDKWINKEEYILTLINVVTQDTRIVKVRDRLELSKVIEGLVNSDYSILDVSVIRNTITGEEFIKELVEENKPDDLNFGIDLGGNHD